MGEPAHRGDGLLLEGLDCYPWVMAFSIINLSAHNAQTVSRRYGLWVALVNAWIIIASPAWAEQVNIIAIGDSLTAGYGLAQSDSFPAQLQAALRAVGERAHIAVTSGTAYVEHVKLKAWWSAHCFHHTISRSRPPGYERRTNS